MNDLPIKVLLIEDDEDDFFLTSEMLKEVSEIRYEIDWIPSYREGLELLRRGEHDVALIDYRLGSGTGIDLLREASAGGCRVPMILLTGQGDRAIDNEATQAGATDYLVKSKVDANVLERAIRYAMAHGRMIRQIRDSENRFRSLVESANDAIVSTDSQGRIVSWNDSATTIFGYGRREASTKFLNDLFASLDGTAGSESFNAAELLQSDSKAVEMIGVRKDGTTFPLEISLSSWATSEGLFYSGIIRDITDRKSLEEQLTQQALHDPLTKLANRVLFRDRVEHAISKIVRSRTAVSVLFLDLDNFKTINDSLGHRVGDLLLVSVAERLRSCLRNSDTPARLGGDEFAVLIEDANHPQEAILISERINDVIRAPFLIEGKGVLVAASIGIASATVGNENPEELLRNADVAMYKAKALGKGRSVFFEAEMREELMERVELEADLHKAVENGELMLFYQPILELRTGGILGMEALARWNHPRHGLVSPQKFIPLAEEGNLILPIGNWVLQQACSKAGQWAEANGAELSISVNLSIRQFQQEDLVRIVSETLRTSGLPPRCLILEITETLMIQNTEAMIRKLTELKGLGIRLAIDDFGTGYSSLSYLHRFPIDILKIDKSFIGTLHKGNEGLAVTRAIIMMAASLNLRVIAEGVENAEQAAVLERLGCDVGQGYFFARPLSEDDMTAYLSGPPLHIPGFTQEFQPELSVADRPPSGA